MLRAIACTSAVLAISGSLTACDTQTITSHTPSPADTSATPTPPDQAAVFFPAPLDTYGLNLSQVDRDHLAELHALRQIDPCGFIAPETLAAKDHPDLSYAHTAVPWIETGGNSPIAPLGGEGCTITFPAAKTGLALQVMPGEPRWNDSQFRPDPAHPGVSAQTPRACTFRVNLPLTAMSGAPESLRDPYLEVTQETAPEDTTATEDTSICPVAEAIADGIGAQVEHTGIPVHSAQSSPVARFLTADPCTAAADLPAAGFVWEEPNPSAQWPTTWRHPGVCNLQLDQTFGGPATAVVKYGLVNWSEDILKMPWGEEPQRDEQDGVELFSFASYLAPGCLVIAKTDLSIEPANIGTGAADLASSTPIVTVQLNGPIGGSCTDTAKQVALNALKRAT